MKILIIALYVLCVFRIIDASYYQRCPSVNIRNGRVKYRNASRIVRFYCNKSFILVGEQSASCTFGNWSSPVPVCASTKCSTLPQLLHGNTRTSHGGAVENLTCDPDFKLIGPSQLICTENGWDNPMPFCQANTLNQFPTCHFEPDELDLCKWILKPSFYRWMITSSTNHGSDGTYPIFDHTVGPHTGGHYLYLENVFPISVTDLRLERKPDNGAKFISPLFPPTVQSEEKWCLIFYLYSYGPTAGHVKILLNNDTAWENIDERVNKWRRVTVSLQHQPFPFRIVIDGKGTLGHYSNTAIDDLRIANGTDCNKDVDEEPYTLEPNIEEEEDKEESDILDGPTVRQVDVNRKYTLSEKITSPLLSTTAVYNRSIIQQDATNYSNAEVYPSQQSAPHSIHILETTSGENKGSVLAEHLTNYSITSRHISQSTSHLTVNEYINKSSASTHTGKELQPDAVSNPSSPIATKSAQHTPIRTINNEMPTIPLTSRPKTMDSPTSTNMPEEILPPQKELQPKNNFTKTKTSAEIQSISPIAKSLIPAQAVTLTKPDPSTAKSKNDEEFSDLQKTIIYVSVVVVSLIVISIMLWSQKWYTKHALREKFDNDSVFTSETETVSNNFEMSSN